jgi:hypothetical protein
MQRQILYFYVEASMELDRESIKNISFENHDGSWKLLCRKILCLGKFFAWENPSRDDSSPSSPCSYVVKHRFVVLCGLSNIRWQILIDFCALNTNPSKFLKKNQDGGDI